MPNDNKPKDKDELSQFCEGVLEFVTLVPQQMVEFIGDVEEAPLATANASLVREHLVRIFDVVEEGFQKSGRLVQADVTQSLYIMNGVGMVNTLKSTAKSAISLGKIGGGFLRWLADNFKEIKKLIGEIIGLIFGKDSKIYSWWVKWQEVLDELWDLIWKLLSPLFGLNRAQFSRELSESEVDYQNELAANARLARAVAGEDDDAD